MILLGPSGCGKSTLLRMVAGLETPTSGDIFIGDVEGQRHRAEDARRGDGVPELRARIRTRPSQANIEFPLKVRGAVEGRSRRQGQGRRPTRSGSAEYLDRKPGQLSGGQRQRVALARAIVRQPAVFCMDEPLSNLDAKLRGETRAELVDLHRRLDATILYVTHDQVEAMTMGTRVAVMSRGQLQQIGTPQRGLRQARDRVRRHVHRHAADERDARRVVRAQRRARRRAARAPAAQRRRRWPAGDGADGRATRPRDAADLRRRRAPASWCARDAEAPVPPIGADVGLDAAEAYRHRFDPVTRATGSISRSG